VFERDGACEDLRRKKGEEIGTGGYIGVYAVKRLLLEGGRAGNDMTLRS
jgi:hypothetical protein